MPSDLIAGSSQLPINRDFTERPRGLLAEHGQMLKLQLAKGKNGKRPQKITSRQ